jgi:hypothetical protein
VVQAVIFGLGSGMKIVSYQAYTLEFISVINPHCNIKKVSFINITAEAQATETSEYSILSNLSDTHFTV